MPESEKISGPEKAMLEALAQGYQSYATKAASWQADYLAEGGRIFCGSGCFGCCNMPIWVSLAEALYMQQALTDSQALAVEQHARQVVANARQSRNDEEYVENHRREVGYCPLLDSRGACSKYQQRPTRCRDTFSAFESECCEVGFWQSLSRREQADYQRAVARHPATDGDTHYIAPLEYLSEGLWKNVARQMRRSWGLEVWGDFWTLTTLAAHSNFMQAVRVGNAKQSKAQAKAAGLWHSKIIEITVHTLNSS